MIPSRLAKIFCLFRSKSPSNLPLTEMNNWPRMIVNKMCLFISTENKYNIKINIFPLELSLNRLFGSCIAIDVKWKYQLMRHYLRHNYISAEHWENSQWISVLLVDTQLAFFVINRRKNSKLELQIYGLYVSYGIKWEWMWLFPCWKDLGSRSTGLQE